MTKDAKEAKDADPDCMLKSRFSASRLRDIILGLEKPRRNLIIARGWGVLLDICAFSAPKGLLEWIVLKINPELGEFRNTRNNTHIVFNKEMVVKALGLPRGTRPVVLTGDHEESPYREFYRVAYQTAGMRAPIHHAQTMLANDDLDEETWFRTFFMVVIGTYFLPGTSSMLPLEYLGSLGDSNLVRENDWAEQIFRHTMSGIKSFQEKWRKAAKDGNFKPVWVGGCLPWIAIVYMDHLDFPVSTLTAHHINYAVPRASHVSDADFKFVMKHDKSRLTLKPHTYGARPFRPFNATPYAIVNANMGNQALQVDILAHTAEVNTNNLGQDVSRHPAADTISLPEELPDYVKTICEKYNSLWLKNVEMLTKNHGKHMTEFASEVLAASKNNASPSDGLSSPPGVAATVASILRESTPTISSPRHEVPAFVEEAANIPDPKQTPSTQFWEEASRIADEVEQSAGKTFSRNDPSSSTHARNEDEAIIETTRPRYRGDDLECPSFEIFPPGETLTQLAAAINEPTPQSVANVLSSVQKAPTNPSGSSHLGKHPNSLDKTSGTGPTINKPSAAKCATSKAPTPEGDQLATSVRTVLTATKNTSGSSHLDKHPNSLDKTSGAEPTIKKPSAAKCATSKAPTLEGAQLASSVVKISQQAPSPDGRQSSQSVAGTIGTQTQDKKNRKKRAFLGINNDANQKTLKKLKATDESKELYDTYIMRRCIRPPVVGEKERPPFVDFGDYHISYEHFREALRPRGRIDTQVMELFIRHFNLVTNIPTTSEPMCTKFAFSQSLTAKLCVREENFDPKSCLKEFMEAYKDHKLKSKDMLYFAVVDNEHWILVSINLLYKQVNFLDSMINAKKTSVYEKAHNLVDNFITLASHSKAFPKTNFSQFVQTNPQDYVSRPHFLTAASL